MIYPDTIGDMKRKGWTDETLEGILERVFLKYVVEREGGSFIKVVPIPLQQKTVEESCKSNYLLRNTKCNLSYALLQSCLPYIMPPVYLHHLLTFFGILNTIIRGVKHLKK